MTETASQKLARQLALAIPALLLGGAYIGEFAFGLYPCEMCWWQRWPHFAALGFGLLASFFRPNTFWIALAAIAILVSGAIGAFHAGVEYGWWQGITACTAAIEAGGDPLEAIMNAPIVRCDVAPWSFLGISLAGWNFVISTLVGLVILFLLARNDTEADQGIAAA
ncbi:disulfide bond formation protein B [Erythrobacter litoralis]|uniref:Disulfide bond formation protein n=1 Tax=Erythrobacter litoralis (strain HTCC2594) TaxID=314225 RepID=Q2N6E9_ERYLH|nr:disulfide bond formation protein B [Erythrobacter litoralis]ABC64742.1 disulfide bond formation protein [Erythrobacter litoralis HTCC2594]